MSSSTSSYSPAPRNTRTPNRKRKRPTEAGWDTTDSEEEQPDNRRRHFDRSPSPKRVNRHQTHHNRNFSNYPERYRYTDIPPDPAYGLDVCEDASRARMRERRRALALGLFKVVTRHDAVPIEEEGSFLEFVRDTTSRRFNYVAVPKGFPSSNYPRTRYSDIDGAWPGSGDRYHVIWITQAGDIKMDRRVKLYDVESIQGHDIDGLSPSPKSLWFSLVDPRRGEGDQVTFDANLFWSVGLLWKHLKTCGVEVWDHDMAALFRMETRPPPPPNVVPPGPPPRPLMNMSIPPPMGAPACRPAAPPAIITLTNSGDHNNNPGATSNAPSASYTLGERYTGCMMEWRYSYGFLSCTLVPGKVFIHIKDIRTSDGNEVFSLSEPVGKSVNFELTMDETTGSRFRAIKAEIFG